MHNKPFKKQLYPYWMLYRFIIITLYLPVQFSTFIRGHLHAAITNKYNSDMMIEEQKLFDLSFLEQMDDVNFLIEIITLYLNDSATDLAAMQQSLEAGDVDAVGKTAHKLKSSTGMLQANVLFNILQNIETTARASPETNQVAAMVQAAQHQFEKLVAPLQLHIKELQKAA